MRSMSSINRTYLLSLYEFHLGDYREAKRPLEALQSVTPAEVKEAARKYLNADRGVLAAVR